MSQVEAQEEMNKADEVRKTIIALIKEIFQELIDEYRE